MANRILLSLLVIAFLFGACGTDVRDQPLTMAAIEEHQEQVKEELTDEEKQLLMAYVARHTMGDAFAAAFSGEDPGENAKDILAENLDGSVTIGKAINKQRTWREEQEARRAEEQRRAEEAAAQREAELERLRGLVSVNVVEKGFREIDYSDYITLEVVIANNSEQDVEGVKGRLVFNDIFGDEIMSVGIKEDQPVAAAEQRVERYTLDYNQFMDDHKKLRNTDLDRMEVDWEPMTILFSDGTRVDVE